MSYLSREKPPKTQTCSKMIDPIPCPSLHIRTYTPTASLPVRDTFPSFSISYPNLSSFSSQRKAVVQLFKKILKTCLHKALSKLISYQSESCLNKESDLIASEISTNLIIILCFLHPRCTSYTKWYMSLHWMIVHGVTESSSPAISPCGNWFSVLYMSTSRNSCLTSKEIK